MDEQAWHPDSGIPGEAVWANSRFHKFSALLTRLSRMQCRIFVPSIPACSLEKSPPKKSMMILLKSNSFFPVFPWSGTSTAKKNGSEKVSAVVTTHTLSLPPLCFLSVYALTGKSVGTHCDRDFFPSFLSWNCRSDTVMSRVNAKYPI